MTVKTATASLAQLPVTLADIEAAATTLAGLVKCTNFDRSRTLSDITGASVWLKFENLQFTATFKERGALNRLAALSADQRQRGVIAASAGNHAQGVAYHAARLSIPATIYVPIGTPTVKIENTRRHGATVIEGGATLEEAAALATTHGQNEGLTFIHPYDDPSIIAGQGTIAIDAKLNPYVVRKSAGIARGLTAGRVRELLADLLTIDERLKTESLNADDVLLDYLLGLSSN